MATTYAVLELQKHSKYFTNVYRYINKTKQHEVSLNLNPSLDKIKHVVYM